MPVEPEERRLLPPRLELAVALLGVVEVELVPAKFAKAYEPLVEGFASDPVPRCASIRASHPDRQQQRDVLDHPGHYRMPRRDLAADRLFQGGFVSPRQSLDLSDCDLDRPVALVVVCHGPFLRDLLQLGHVLLGGLHGLLQELGDGPLVVGFQADFPVSKPFDVLEEPLHRVLVSALRVDHMGEDRLAPSVLHNEDLEENLLRLDLFSRVDVAFPARASRHEEIIEGDHWFLRAVVLFGLVGLAHSSCSHTGIAPRAVWQVVDVVVIDLFLGRCRGYGRDHLALVDVAGRTNPAGSIICGLQQVSHARWLRLRFVFCPKHLAAPVDDHQSLVTRRP